MISISVGEKLTDYYVALRIIEKMSLLESRHSTSVASQHVEKENRNCICGRNPPRPVHYSVKRFFLCVCEFNVSLLAPAIKQHFKSRETRPGLNHAPDTVLIDKYLLHPKSGPTWPIYIYHRISYCNLYVYLFSHPI